MQDRYSLIPLGERGSGPGPYDSPSDPDPCPDCGGEGFVIGHEDECYEHGCVCSGVQIQCSCQREPLREQEIEF